MQHPALWMRLGLLWCLLMFAACGIAGTKAATAEFSGSPRAHPIAIVAPPSTAATTALSIANSQASVTHKGLAANGAVVHAIPTLDGFGLFVLAALLGVGVLWFRRRRQ